MPAPTTYTFEVSAEDAGLRLDQALARNVPDLSRRKARALLDIGGVFVDRRRVKVASRKVRAGQKVEAHIGGAFERATKEVGARARARDEARLPEYRIVHEDDELVVVDKPAGLLAAPTPESDRGNLADMLSRRGRGTAWVVHRIDLPTSGLLVFARSDAARVALSELFRRHDIERVYRAVCAGRVKSEALTIDDDVGGKPAVTHVEVVRHLGDAATEVAARLETGRTHQIRIHLAGRGHPVLGDTAYGAPDEHGAAPRPPRLALHAARLGFVHPTTGERVTFDSPWPPEDLAGWLHALAPDGGESP